jgi:hypothetical protein
MLCSSFSSIVVASLTADSQIFPAVISSFRSSKIAATTSGLTALSILDK